MKLALGQYSSIRHMEWKLFLSFIESFRTAHCWQNGTMVHKTPDEGPETDLITWYVSYKKDKPPIFSN